MDPKAASCHHFYFHDTLSSKNPSAVEAAEASMTKKSPFLLFGLLNIFDDLLTKGLNPPPCLWVELKPQGLYGSAGQQELSLLVAMSFVFTTGKFNGSSLTILGRNAALQPLREMPIIGGTGAFRLARGFVIAKTYFLNFTTGDAIVKYHAVAIHYGVHSLSEGHICWGINTLESFQFP